MGARTLVVLLASTVVAIRMQRSDINHDVTVVMCSGANYRIQYSSMAVTYCAHLVW